ncbi:MAG: hypothetical protein ACXVXI_06430, partial [Mycobacteriaceae bacterium]
MGDGEVYLEAGAWRGTSICAAALDNVTGRFVTVDDFSAFGGPKDECLENEDLGPAEHQTHHKARAHGAYREADETRRL